MARALIDDGWLVRNKIIWAKTNPLPSPVPDRLTTTHEYVYLFVRRPSYYFDLDAIREPLASGKRNAQAGTRTPATELAGPVERQPGWATADAARRPQRPSARQEPRGRLATGVELLPRRALRDLSARTRSPPDPGRLSAAGLYPLPTALAPIGGARGVEGREAANPALRALRLSGADPPRPGP